MVSSSSFWNKLGSTGVAITLPIMGRERASTLSCPNCGFISFARLRLTSSTTQASTVPKNNGRMHACALSTALTEAKNDAARPSFSLPRETSIHAVPVFDPPRENTRMFFPRRPARVVAPKAGLTSNT